MKKILTLTLATLAFYYSSSQTKEELVAEMNAKKDSIAILQGKVNAIQAKIDAIPGWRFGAFGTIGGSLSRFNNWYAQGIPNNTSGNIGFTFNTFANLKQDNYFWRNSMNLNLAWVRLDNRDIDTDSEDFEVTNDVFSVNLSIWVESDKDNSCFRIDRI